MNPQIRPAPPEVIGDILALSRLTLEEHLVRQPFAFAPDMHESSFEPGLLQSFHDEAGTDLTKSREILAAFDGDSFLGYVWFRGSNERGAWAEIIIFDIAVMPEWRGQGIGRALAKAVVDLARAKDTTNLTAHVWAGNTASARMFAGLGFTSQKETVRFGPLRQLPPLRQSAPSLTEETPAERSGPPQAGIPVIGGLVTLFQAIVVLAAVLAVLL